MAKKLAFDPVLFGTVALLVLSGLVMVYSTSAPLARETGLFGNPLLFKQTVAALIGFGLMFVAMHFDYRRLREPAVIYTLVGGVVLVLVAVLFGPERNNTHRWFYVAGFSLQPAEFAKLALIPYIAYQIERKPEFVDRQEVLIPVLGVTGLVVGLILLQPDFGTSVLLIVAVGLVLFLAGLGWKYLALVTGIALPVLALVALSAPYRVRRLLAFRNPEADPLGDGFQALQSLIAVGSGGLFGRAEGSVQKLHFLPLSHSDYIFAIVCEELGFLGAITLLTLFSLLLWRGIKAGLGAPDLLGRYLAWGFTGLLVVQALMHISVSLAIAPTKGIPLPFISYGGTSLMASLAACGVVLNVSQHG
ncbi:MAG: putative peptidoglycan glycosyltransferase FtsW [Thermoanaerobaculia bacterium]|nr:putative peptidoglycan glycosyltransferase FtsW [Thermoanaerobaculia bacterium]